MKYFWTFWVRKIFIRKIKNKSNELSMQVSRQSKQSSKEKDSLKKRELLHTDEILLVLVNAGVEQYQMNLQPHRYILLSQEYKKGKLTRTTISLAVQVSRKKYLSSEIISTKNVLEFDNLEG